MFVVEYCFPPSNKVYAKNHDTFQQQRKHIDNIIMKGGIILRDQEFDASRMGFNAPSNNPWTRFRR